MKLIGLSIVGPTVLALALGAGCNHTAAASQTGAVQPAPFTTPPMLAGAPDVATLVAKVKPAVVNITTTRNVKVSNMSGMQGMPFSNIPGFQEFFGGQGMGQGEPQQQEPDRMLHEKALGSGIIVDAQGHVVTNAHVIDGADVVKIKLPDDREFSAKVIGKDTRLDVAVLKLENAPRDLPVASLGSSDALRVGEYVVAIGNPFGLGSTVTMGIVSAKGRVIGAGPYDDFIQTDASINPGNSGGPLFDLHGQVIGINTAINPQGKGIGFAIPIDEVKQALPELIAHGHVARGQLGVMIQGMDEDIAKALGMDRPHGALVGAVNDGSPASRAGIKAGDVVTSVDGQEVRHSSDLPRMIASHAPGTHVKLGVLRSGHTLDADVTLGALQDAEPRAETTSDDSSASPSSALGLQVHEEGGQVIVDRVAPNGPADGKIEAGDVILEVNRRAVTTASGALAALRSAPGTSPILLRVKHGDQTRFVAIDRQQ
ncbi:MAG TPA: Do family serine endopeptidase [Polyangiaceae bacterium]|jgi:serine protease Do